MTTAFPTDLDTFTNPTASDYLDDTGVEHPDQHADANDAIEALEAKVGKDGSAVTSSLDYRVNALESTPAGPGTDIQIGGSVGASDDEFDDASFTGWTKVESGSHLITVTERDNRLSVAHPGGDSSAEMHGIVKSATINSGAYVESCISAMGVLQNFNVVGLVFANGSTYGAGAQALFYFSIQEQKFYSIAFTNYSSAGSFNSVNNWEMGRGPRDLFMRWKYEGSNHFRGYVSPDGISWVDITGQQTITLTPSHFGVVMSTWGGASAMAYSFRYIRLG